MQSELVTTDTSLAAIRDEWNRLAGDDPLQTWEWRAAWWKFFGPAYDKRRRLAIGVVRQAGQVVGIAPCFTERGPIQGQKLVWLGSGKACTDYQRFLIAPEADVAYRTAIVDHLVDAIYDHVARRAQQDIWDLDGVEPTVAATTELEGSLRRRGFSVHAEPIDSSWVMDLPGDWKTFVSGCHRGVRRKINKAERRAAGSSIHYFRATTPEKIAAFWPEFVRLHAARFSTKVADGGCFADPTFAQFLPEAIRLLSERGLVRLYWCEVHGTPISTQLYLLSGRSAQMYQSGFDPSFAQYEPGYLLYTHVLHDLIDSGFTTFDFLRGDETYKSGWNTRKVPLVRLFCVPPRRTAQLRHKTYLWARGFKRAAKQTWSKQSTDDGPSKNQVEPEAACNA